MKIEKFTQSSIAGSPLTTWTFILIAEDPKVHLNRNRKLPLLGRADRVLFTHGIIFGISKLGGRVVS